MYQTCDVLRIIYSRVGLLHHLGQTGIASHREKNAGTLQQERRMFKSLLTLRTAVRSNLGDRVLSTDLDNLQSSYKKLDTISQCQL